MRDFFTGKEVELLTKDRGISGIRVWHMNLEENELGHMSCRLDEAVTFIYIIRGNMICQINQEKEELKQGEGMFINSRNAYRFMSGNGNGCELYLTAVEEAYLNADDVTAGKYVNPIVNEEEIFGLKLNYESGEKKEALSLIRNIGEISKMKDIGYELELRSLVFGLWLNLYRELQNNVRKIKKAELRDKIKLYRMLEYLHAHYTEKITLSEMAENSDVSTGEYCRFFKKRMEQTPFEYLQAYRIEQSIPEMLDKTESIMKIALKHGFTGSSYYSETFKKEMGCSPGDYRKWCRTETVGECPLKHAKEQPPATVKKSAPAPEPVPVRRRESMPAHLL